MLSKYVLASVLATIRATLNGVGVALTTVAAYAEHALVEVCYDIDNDRQKKIDALPKVEKSKKDTLN